MDAKLSSIRGEAQAEQRLPGRVLVRNSRDADVPAMLAIYLHHIRRGVDPGIEENEFETPDAEDLKRRRKSMQRRKMPHILAEDGGVVVGYAYAVPFRKRPAYRYTVKHSIYVHNDHLRRGIGRLLMGALIDACAAAGFRQMIGYIDFGQPRLARPSRGVRLRQGRLSAFGRLQVRPLDGHGHGPAVAWARRDRAAADLIPIRYGASAGAAASAARSDALTALRALTTASRPRASTSSDGRLSVAMPAWM